MVQLTVKRAAARSFGCCNDRRLKCSSHHERNCGHCSLLGASEVSWLSWRFGSTKKCLVLWYGAQFNTGEHNFLLHELVRCITLTFFVGSWRSVWLPSRKARWRCWPQLLIATWVGGTSIWYHEFLFSLFGFVQSLSVIHNFLRQC